MTLIISSSRFAEFKAYLENNGFSFEERPYQAFLAKKKGVTVNLYLNGKIVIGGAEQTEKSKVEDYLASLEASQVEKAVKEYPSIEVSGTRIGTDEVGKGDYFGPLVIGGVLANENQVNKLQTLGVKDSKALSDVTIKNLSVQINKILEPSQRDIILIRPLKYNMLHKDLGNVNGILGWGHARAIENLLSGNAECEYAVADQFGDQSYIEKALMQRGKKITLIQSPKAEREIAVAAASILARSVFIDEMREMSKTYGLDFPKGSTDVIPTATKFVEMYGGQALVNVAKTHFATTKQIPNVGQVQAPNPAPFQEQLPTIDAKISREIRLECYSLIDSFEPEMRKFIETKLRTLFGDEWWDKGVDIQIRRKAEAQRDKEKARGVEAELIDCLDMDHYRLIMTDSPNWKSIFGPVFKDEAALLARLKILKDIRNPVAHSRGLLKYADKLGVVSAIQWLNSKIKGEIGI